MVDPLFTVQMARSVRRSAGHAELFGRNAESGAENAVKISIVGKAGRFGDILQRETKHNPFPMPQANVHCVLHNGGAKRFFEQMDCPRDTNADMGRDVLQLEHRGGILFNVIFMR